MVKRFIFIFISLIVFFVGCDEDKPSIKTSVEQNNDDVGMLEYLKQQRLPALKDVELWPNKYGLGLKMTTAHYEIFTTLLDPLMLSQIPAFLESAHRGYNNQLPRPIATMTKSVVYLFADRGQWESFTKAFAGRKSQLLCKIKAGAYYLNGACVTYNIGRARTFSVLGHEGWHQFSSRHFRYRLPSWLDEGIAMMFETHRKNSGLFYFEPGRNMYRLGALRKTLARNKMIPLRQLVAINPGEVLATKRDEAVAAFYAQSYAVIRFLREDNYGRRLDNFHRLLLGAVRGDWPLDETSKKIAIDRNIPLTIRWNRTVGTQLFEHYVSDDFEAIEKEYLAFCRKIVYHVRLKTKVM